MHWLKRNLWKIGIIIADILILLLTTWIPLSAASAHEGPLGGATPGTVTVQATPTPTVDATVTALNKEKLVQEVKQIQQSNDRNLSGWLWNFGSTSLTALTAIAAGFFALIRWLDDRRKEREKQSEDLQIEQQKQEKERFESLISVITALQDEKVGERIRAAIMLRMVFLRPGNEQFYGQIFILAADNLRVRHTGSNTAESNEQFRRYLITVFKEAFPLARNLNTGSPQLLDSTGVQLDNAYLGEADLKQVWMPQASLQDVDLSRANLSGANLSGADLSGADLSGADLSRANLSRANLSRANLSRANLSRANLSGAKLSGAKLSGAYLFLADLSGANLSGADLSEAGLIGAKFQGTDLSGARLSKAYLSRSRAGSTIAQRLMFDYFIGNLSVADLSRTSLEEALSLDDTDLRGVKGLTKEQLATCKAKGAIIDEDSTTSSTQSTASPPPPSQSNDAQASSAPSAQGSLPISDTGGSSAAASQQDSES